MRIVGGRYKGHQLTAPAGSTTRPTADRVRESIFNILAHGVPDFDIEGARVIDLFAGTGALGLEALSRGARWCHFVDESAQARAAIRTNADKLGLIGQCKIWRRDATALGPCPPLAPFDLAFADPPYGKGLGAKALRSLLEGGWMNAGGVIMLEEAEDAAPAAPDGLAIFDARIYGDTKVMFFRRA
jgi:16S rRNA (guanine966-N2)-methyltransferase